MNEPFLLSNLIDLQDLDNEITKLITKKSEGETVVELKNLEKKYKNTKQTSEILKDAMGEYYTERKDFDKKLLESENKLSKEYSNDLSKVDINKIGKNASVVMKEVSQNMKNKKEKDINKLIKK